MNIVFVNATKGWAGIKTWMLELADFLTQRGHRAQIVCRPGDLLQEACAARHLPCRTLTFGMDFSPAAIWWFWQLFRQEHTEALVTNIGKDVRAAGVAAKLRGLAHINRLGLHGDLANTRKNRLVYNGLVDRVFVPSQGLFTFFAAYEFLRPKLRQFYNGILPPPFAMPNNSVVKFATVANLSKRKQIDHVLRAFHRLRDLPWEFHIGGDGPELSNLQALTQELELTARVFFSHSPQRGPGFQKVDPCQFLRDKDVGILYSTQEGLPNGLLEYMALCCAALASDIEGNREIIQDQDNGLLVPPDDLAALERALRLLVTAPEFRQTLIRRGYETIQTRFHRDIVFARVEEEIRRTIASKAKVAVR